jgi:hypothetical protein
LFRFGNVELIQKQGVVESFARVIKTSDNLSLADNAINEAKSIVRRVVSEDANFEIRERAALCFALHMAIEIWPREPYEQERFMERLLI